MRNTVQGGDRWDPLIDHGDWMQEWAGLRMSTAAGLETISGTSGDDRRQARLQSHGCTVAPAHDLRTA